MKIVTLSDVRALMLRVGLAEWYRLLLSELQQDFSQWQAFHKCPRHVTHYDHGVIELMPTSTDESYVFKYVNGHPNNPKKDWFTVVALGLLADVDSGYPLICLLYTSDAADDLLCVDLGGRRIIKKK